MTGKLVVAGLSGAGRGLIQGVCLVTDLLAGALLQGSFFGTKNGGRYRR